MKVNYAIPGMFERYTINILYLELIKEHPEYFLDNLNINAVYGNFQYCTWDGGRSIIIREHTSFEKINILKHIYNDILETPIRFVFTNGLLEERDLYDRFNNLVLEICQDPKNEIVVNSQLLEDYIRENYPDYGLISSTTKCLNTHQTSLEELSKDYKFICLDYNLNKDYDFLKNFSKEQKTKSEILINPICGINCPSRKKHYNLISNATLKYREEFVVDNCKITVGNFYPYDNARIEPDEIKNFYIPNGFLNFKIEGRTAPPEEVILNLVKYTVKPEYQYYVMSLLFREYNIYKDNNKILSKFKEKNI